jgi:hypothetical protein
MEKEQTENRRSYDFEFVYKLDEIFLQHKDVFYNDATKAAFTLGILTQMLLDLEVANNRKDSILDGYEGRMLAAKDIPTMLKKAQKEFLEFGEPSPASTRMIATVSHYIVAADKFSAALPAEEVTDFFNMGRELLQMTNNRAQEVSVQQS